MHKDESILAFLERLRADLGPAAFDVVDHWDADLCAIGVTREGAPKGLVYVSTYACPPGRYYLDLEDALTFDPTGEPEIPRSDRIEDADYATALARIKEHLGI